MHQQISAYRRKTADCSFCPTTTLLIMALSAPLASAQSLLQEAADRRVDVVMIGDSNQLFGGHGFEEAYSLLLSSRYGLYSTGVHWFGENVGNGAGVGYQCTTLNTAGAGVFSYQQSPPGSDPLNPSGVDLAPANAITLQTSSFASVGIGLSANSPYFSIGDLLEFRGSFQTWGANAALRPQVRLGAPPYTVWAQTPLIGYESGVREFVLQWSATSTTATEFRLGGGLAGPWTAYFASICNASRGLGVSVNTFYGNGGRSARDCAESFANLDPFVLQRFLTHIHSRQHSQAGGPYVVVRIAFGLNDINEQLNSILTGFPSSSPAGFVENLGFIKQEFESSWISFGWDINRLEFIISTPHPISHPNDARLEAFCSAVDNQFNDERVRTVHLTRLTNFQDMATSGLFASNTDRYHLTRNGYLALAELEIDDILNDYCPADINQDRNVDGDDLIAFFSYWDNSESIADFNLDTQVDGDDVIDFFSKWDTGC